MTMYHFSSDRFQIEDEKFQLSYSLDFTPPLRTVLENEMDGLVERYSKKGNTLLEKYGVYHGKKHGQFLLYFSSGQIASERWYIDGVLCGKALDFFSNGKEKASFGYKNGLLHGPFLEWHESGPLLLQGGYQNGLAQGTFLTRNAQGFLTRTTSFEKGRRNGVDAGMSEDGYLLFLDKWSMGEKTKSSIVDCLERYLLN